MQRNLPHRKKLGMLAVGISPSLNQCLPKRILYDDVDRIELVFEKSDKFLGYASEKRRRVYAWTSSKPSILLKSVTSKFSFVNFELNNKHLYSFLLSSSVIFKCYT